MYILTYVLLFTTRGRYMLTGFELRGKGESKNDGITKRRHRAITWNIPKIPKLEDSNLGSAPVS